eukprot:COSAG05_NODE_3268_length_2190_cov_10.189861_2_plen_109_part_00
MGFDTYRGAHMDFRIPCFQLFSLSHPSLLLLGPRGAGRGRNKAPAMVERPMPLSAPASLGRPPPAGKLHTQPGYVGERAVAAGDPELGLLGRLGIPNTVLMIASATIY